MELKCPSIHFLTKFYCAGPCVKQGTDTKGHEAQALSLESTVLCGKWPRTATEWCKYSRLDSRAHHSEGSGWSLGGMGPASWTEDATLKWSLQMLKEESWGGRLRAVRTSWRGQRYGCVVRPEHWLA